MSGVKCWEGLVLGNASDLLWTAVAHQRDAVLITEAEPRPGGRRIVFVNEAFTQMTGWSADEAIGRTPDLTVGESTDRESIRRIVHATNTQTAVRERILKYRKDGSSLWVELDLAPVRDEAGQVRFFVSVMRDITEQKLQADLLQAHADTLARISQQQTQFLATLSHEMRTPLSVILGTSSMMLEGMYDSLTSLNVSALRRVEGNARTLHALIEELLDHARLEAGKVAVSAQRFAPHALVREVVFELATPSAPPMRVDGACDLVVDSDRRKVKQIVTNLVSNAIKFTPQGAIQVDVGDAGDNVEIAVTDSGVGIAPADQERVFEQYWQANGLDAQRRGAGLGLFISRQLARLLGGGLTLKSELGRGSTFTLRLPRSAAE